jgi:hypothetical protein
MLCMLAAVLLPLLRTEGVMLPGGNPSGGQLELVCYRRSPACLYLHDMEPFDTSREHVCGVTHSDSVSLQWQEDASLLSFSDEVFHPLAHPLDPEQ